MNRLITKQLLASLTTGLILLLPSLAGALDFSLPEEMTVSVGHRKVKGFQWDPDYVKKLVERVLEDPSSEKAKNFPEEGFVYRSKDGIEDGFEVIAWSSKGQMKEIVKVAKSSLLEMIDTQSEDKPVGWKNSRAERTDLASLTMEVGEGKLKHKFAPSKKLDVVAEKSDKKFGGKGVLPKDPNLYVASIAQLPDSSLASALTSSTDDAGQKSGGIDWKLILTLLIILVLLAVFTRAAFLIKV